MKLRLLVSALLLSGCLGDDNNGPDDADAIEEVAEDVAVDTADEPDTADAPDTDTQVDTLEDTDEPDTTPDVEPPDADVEPDAGDTAAPDADDGDVVDAETFDPLTMCDNLPAGPFQLTKLQGPLASEDLAFTSDGKLVGSDDNAIFKSEYNKPPKPFVPNFQFRAGLRYLPNGHLIVCDDTRGELVRVDPTGTKHPVLTGLSYPNGLEVDLNGFVYFTEHDANQVWRVDPYSGDKTLLTDKIASPNGVAFSPDYSRLYLGGFNGDPTVYVMNISPNGTPGKLVPLASVGSGWHDGIAVDACGNIYLADYEATQIWRMDANGENGEVIIDGSVIDGTYLPNLQWGTGVGGWDAMSIYLPDGWNKGVFEVWLGVPSKPRAFP